MPSTACVFEHGTLSVGEQGLTAKHFESLVHYNDRQGCRLYKVGHQRIHFGSFVGVLQVGSLTIEILPKAEKGAHPSQRKWQRALLQMLRISGVVDLEAAPDASLQLRRSPLIDIYLNSFLSELERITHAGLVKKYRICEGNLHKLKGRILFRQQISRNLLHRERMFTAHQAYDVDNVFNRILKRALGLVSRLELPPAITARAAALELSFEHVSDAQITSQTFEHLESSRNTHRYNKALQLARLLILNYSPDLRGGREGVLAFLLDMNVLFERFILVQLLRAQAHAGREDIQIKAQASKHFWATKTIRPDVVIEISHGSSAERLILDTKWKIPYGDRPSDEDLKQMYAYNLHFGAHTSLLVYPRAGKEQAETRNSFSQSAALPHGHRHSCGTHFIELFDEHQSLRTDIGTQLLCRVLSAIDAQTVQ